MSVNGFWPSEVFSEKHLSRVEVQTKPGAISATEPLLTLQAMEAARIELDWFWPVVESVFFELMHDCDNTIVRI